MPVPTLSSDQLALLPTFWQDVYNDLRSAAARGGQNEQDSDYLCALQSLARHFRRECEARGIPWAAHGDQAILTTPAQDANSGLDACPP